MAHGLTYSFPFSDAFVASLQLLYAKTWARTLHRAPTL